MKKSKSITQNNRNKKAKEVVDFDSTFLQELRNKAVPMSKEELKELEEFRKQMPTKLKRNSLVNPKTFKMFRMSDD